MSAAYLSMLHLSLRVADRRVAHLDPRRLRRNVTVLVCRDQNNVTASAVAAAAGMHARSIEVQKRRKKRKGVFRYIMLYREKKN